MASPSQFARAHVDAQRAVATFLPSLGPKPPAPPPPPPHPMAKQDVMHAMLHGATLARHVEGNSAKIARGLPPDPPKPPGPEEQFGNVLDVVHIRAISSAIEAHPETERGRLISEAHDSLTKFIMGHNGKVIVHGKVLIAHDMKGAQSLAARIVNEALDEHDQRQADEADAIQAGQSEKLARSRGGKGGKSNPGNDGSPAGTGTSVGIRQAANGGDGSPDGSLQSGPAVSAPQSAGEGILAGGVGSDVSADAAGSLPGASAEGGGEGTSDIGSVDPASGRVITHSTSDLGDAQRIATAAAPDLEDQLQQVADSTPGIEVHGVRPEKDKDRAERKVEADDKPVDTHSDLLAGRLIADSPEAKDAAVDALKNAAPVIDEEDSFQNGDPDYGFRSHDLQVGLNGDKGPTSAEVQIVPKEVADADEETHPTYEKGRDAEAEGDTETADKAKAENKAVHDAAMDKFNERNQVEETPRQQGRTAKLHELLKQAGFDVTGEPVRIGGHAFLPIKETDDGA